MRAIAPASLLLPLLLLPGTSTADEPADPSTRAQQLLAEARAETRALDELLDAAGSRSVQRELHRKTQHLEQIYDELATTLPAAGGAKQQVDDGGYGIVGGAVEGPSPPPVAIAERELDGIMVAIEAQSFSDGKLAILRSVAPDSWFSSEQVRRIMELFTFGDGKVAAGTLLYPRVVDPEHWYVVYEAFDFDSDRAELREAVGR